MLCWWFFYWYTYEAILKRFVYTIGNILHMNFLVYVHCFMSIKISNMTDHSIPVYQAIYATSVVGKYLDPAKVKTSTDFHNTTLPSDIIFTKSGASISDEQVEKLTSEFNIHYRNFIGYLVYLLSTRLDLIFQYTSYQSFHQILIKYILEDWYIYWGTLGTIRPWVWSIMMIWMMHLYLTCWYKLVLRQRISWWFSLILVGSIFHTLEEIQEHILYFIKVGKLTMSHIFQDKLLNQVQKVITNQHALKEYL